VKRAAQRYLDPSNYVQVVLGPDKGGKAVDAASAPKTAARQ
jgi:predicted Zn-dependent peptidase